MTQNLLESLKVAIISESAGNWPVYIGLDKGFFIHEGLDVQVTITRSSIKQMDALKAGQHYDIGHQAIDHIIRAVESGFNLCAFMGIAKPNYSLIVSQDIRNYDELKEKKLGVDGVSTGFALLLKTMMTENGLFEGKDYELVQIGGTGERYQAVINGIVAGALLDGPIDIKAEEAGLNRLGSNLDYIPQYQGTVAATQRQWAKNNKDKLIKYIRAYIRASDWLHELNNKDDAVSILQKYLDVDSNLAAKTYDRYLISETFNRQGQLELAGISEVMKVMASTGQLDATLDNPAKYCEFDYYYQALDTKK